MAKDPKQLSLIDENIQADNGPVVCIGMTFENEEARREYFRNELRKKLPELKQIEGFPIGEDEDIIALSDPPYYTACPNPWVNDFIEEWEKEKVEKFGRDLDEEYHREPFAADVSEGKYNKIYKFYPYPTKVPHKAVMRYILHYTNPGDIVSDIFSGTGMTGVAGTLCGNKQEVLDLGYKVDKDGIIYKLRDEEDSQSWIPFSKLGERKVVLNDLSTSASFIANNFNSIDTQKEYDLLDNVLEEVNNKQQWMFKTQHIYQDSLINSLKSCHNEEEIIELFDKNKDKLGNINFIAWSDVFVCPSCSTEVVYWDNAVIKETGKIKDIFFCDKCNAELKKGIIERAKVTKYDILLEKTIEVAKQVPVLINYSIGNKRFVKQPGQFDLELINRIENLPYKFWIPSNELPKGVNTNQPITSHKFNYVHLFYTNRNVRVLGSFVYLCQNQGISSKILLRITNRITKMYGLTFQSGKWGAGGGPLSGTLYVPSLAKELNMIKQLKSSIDMQRKKDWNKSNGKKVVSTQASNSIDTIPSNSIDYLFIDPPFGGNLMYSELNFIPESWLKVFTNNRSEAIVNNIQHKSNQDYKYLISLCLKEAFRIIKPGHWLTVEFSNTKSNIWTSIQNSIEEAGFIIANVSALDKQKGSVKAITSTVAVKQDLVISAYKPKQANVEKMRREQNTQESAWTFVSQYLEQLPVFIGNKGEAQIISERTPRILFDRMVAYHVQNGLPVPISSSEFQIGVAQRFPMRDGMAFLENQVAEYDKKRTLVKDFSQMSLFVSDESSAIEWIRQQLLKKPQTRQDLHPNYMKEIQHIAKHELLPELDDLLHQNFLRYDGDENVPDQIVSYLRKNYKDLRGLEPSDPTVIDKALNRWYVPDPNKQADLEKLREKALLREFDGYLEEMENNKKKKLKQFRTEAIRAGFKKAYSEKDFEKIVTVGDRLPESIIQEDDKLLMYFDNASIRLGL